MASLFTIPSNKEVVGQKKEMNSKVRLWTTKE